MKSAPLNISDFATLYQHDNDHTGSVSESASSEPPLIVLYSWLGASPAGVHQYVKLYHDKGVDVLVIHGYLFDFLVVGRALTLAKKTLDYLLYEQSFYKKYLVHAFSIGAFHFTVCSMLAKERSEIYGDFINRLGGTILDSFVLGSWEQMATGISKIISHYYCIQWLTYRAVLLYLSMSSEETQEFYRKAIEHITNAFFDKPALFFYSHNDRMCDMSVLQDLLTKWRNKNVSPVCVRHWPKSVHTAHLKFHTHGYLEAWEKFCDLLPEIFHNNSSNISKEKSKL